MFNTKTWAIAVLSLIVAVTVMSCNDSPTSGQSVSATQLLGTWVIDKVDMKGNVNYQGMNIQMDTTMEAQNDSSYFTFYSNNTFSANMDESIFGGMGMAKRKVLSKIIQSTTKDTGTWSLSGNSLSMTSLVDDTTIVCNAAINGNTLSMTIPIKLTEQDMSIDVVETIISNKK